ncbi:hypothetical protein [Thermus scotoductus]|uniref:hypothetical protein n=1 Tax=Thermus scotoductus TaxID=37636 RepID=UPI001C12A02C|nr:hypothetical protein [Thermus scotoductus]
MSVVMEALSRTTWAYFLVLLESSARRNANPEEDPLLGPLLTAIRHQRGALPTTEEAWREALLDLLAEAIAKGWDRYGAPTAARHPTEEGRWVGSFEGPKPPYTVEASSKREAYRLARREWVRRMLGGS